MVFIQYPTSVATYLGITIACLSSLPVSSADTFRSSTSLSNNTTIADSYQHCDKTTDSVRFKMYVAVLIFVFVVGLLGNLIAVTVIMFSRSLRRQWTNIFVASLNMCDIGVILCVVPFRIDGYLYDNFCFNIHVCRFFNTADTLLYTSSISHLFVMAIERFIAVRVPFLYQRIFNRSLTIKIIAGTWFYAILWTVASTISWDSLPLLESSAHITEAYISRRNCVIENKIFFVTVYVFVYIIPLGVMAVLYSLILVTALKQQKKMSSLTPSYLRQDDQATQKRKQEVSASKTVAVIYGAFTICLLPMAIITILFQVCPNCLLSFQANHKILADTIFTSFLVVLPALHSCVNPFIYIIFHRRFRKALKALLQGKFKALTEHSFRKGSKSNASASGASPAKTVEVSV